MASNSDSPKKLNLLMSTALVAGTMIGSGIFLLPASLAAFGGISILGWLFTSLGAMLLALALSRLSRIIPKAGGPYAFTKTAFGEFAGFLVGWGYWLALLAGLAAVAVAAVGYLGVFGESVANTPLLSALVAILLVWLLALSNIRGVRTAGIVQLLTTILKILPLLLVIILGIVIWDFENFTPFNVSESSNFGAVTATATMTLWAFLGIESATVAAENVENPEVNVARSTVYGMTIAAIIYILGSMAVMAIVPIETLQNSTAPFSDAAQQMLGSGAEYFVAIGAIISCIGAMNGLFMMTGQTLFALSRDNLFHPKLMVLSKRGTPVRALVLSGILVTIFILLNFSRGLVDLFTFIILLSTLSILLPFAFSTMSEMMILIRKKDELPANYKMKTTILGLLAFAYSMWAISGAGREIVFWGFLLFLSGMPFYVLFKWINRE